MERRIPQAKTFKGEIAPPSSLLSLTRIALLASRARGETTVHRPPGGQGAEALARFLTAHFQNLTLEEGRWRLLGLQGNDSRVPGRIDVGASSGLLEVLCPLFFDHGILVEGEDAALNPRVRRILKTLSGAGFSFDLLEAEGRFRLTLMRSAPGVVSCTLDNGDEAVKTACLMAIALAAGAHSRLVEPIPVGGESEGILGRLGSRVFVAEREDETPEEEGVELSELEKRIRKLQHKRREPGEPSARVLTVEEPGSLNGASFDLYADPLLAAPFLAAAALHPNGNVRVTGLSPEGALPFVSFLQRCGARVDVDRGKAYGSCSVQGSKLSAREIRGRQSAALGELLPFAFVAGAYAEGETIFRDAAFLRDGPVDLIDGSVKNLRAMGAKVGELPDGLIIEGGKEFDGAEFDAFGSPAMAMAFSAAALRNRGESLLKGAEAVDALWPDFFFQLDSLTKGEA